MDRIVRDEIPLRKLGWKLIPIRIRSRVIQLFNIGQRSHTSKAEHGRHELYG